MANPQPKAMTGEEFDAWHQTQLERYEFVDGVPKLKFASWDGAKMMVGATQAHNAVALNTAAELRRALKGRSCRPFLADGKVMIPRGNYRYPDVAVDCGPFSPRATALSEPVLVVEVLSRGTLWIDTTRKLEDYKSTPSIRHILLLMQDEPRGQLWTRSADWALTEIEGLDDVIALGALDISLDVATLYEGVVAPSA